MYPIMKSLFISLALILTVGLTLPSSVFAQKFPDLDKSPLDIAAFPKRGANKVVRVTYSRPYKKDREIFGGKVKYGKVWRLGANEATEITFYQDVRIGDQSVPAGTYALFAIPKETQWTLILNSKLNQWGAFTYKKKLDVARFPAEVSKTDEVIENFSISFDKSADGVIMHMAWDQTMASLPIFFD